MPPSTGGCVARVCKYPTPRARVGTAAAAFALSVALVGLSAWHCHSTYKGGPQCGVDPSEDPDSPPPSILDIFTYAGGVPDTVLNVVALWSACLNFILSDFSPQVWWFYFVFLCAFQVGVCVWPLSCIGVSGVWCALMGTQWAILARGKSPVMRWLTLQWHRRVTLIVTSVVCLGVFCLYPDPFTMASHTFAMAAGACVGSYATFPAAVPPRLATQRGSVTSGVSILTRPSAASRISNVEREGSSVSTAAYRKLED